MYEQFTILRNSIYAPILHPDLKLNFSYFSAKTYVVGTKKNRLNDTIFLSTQNTLE